jgi:hypothetical protein
MHLRRKNGRLRKIQYPLSFRTLLAFLLTIQNPAVSFSYMLSTCWRRQLPCLSPSIRYLRTNDFIGDDEEESLLSSSVQEVEVDIVGIPDDDDDGPSLMEFQLQPEDPFQATGTEDLMKTLAGGPALIFEMARRSILFVQESAMGDLRPQQRVLPRWHPHSGISDANPSFRTQSPAMNNQGFAKSIWRNVRKRNKPTLWRNALRTYDRMAILEEDPINYIKIQRSNIHHEGAMLACAKLGLWQRALEIYHYVYQQEQEGQALFNQQEQEIRPASSSSTISDRRVSSGSAKRKRVYVTDNMVLSLVRACVRASRLRSRRKKNPLEVPTPLSLEQEEREAALRRIPLDTALEVLSTLQEDHNIPLVAYFVNPLASAYQSLGYVHEGREILQTMLSNRTAGEEPEDGVDIFNVYDLCAKDKGSYSLLVQGAVVAGDWGSAVEALADMTNAGLYPNRRHCNVWSEISERQTRPRAVGSWKKKRDDYWTDSVR